jgi:hypothetical protein
MKRKLKKGIVNNNNIKKEGTGHEIKKWRRGRWRKFYGEFN